MAKLHELIAIEKDIKSTATRTISAVAQKFTKDGIHSFYEMRKKYSPINAEDQDIPDQEFSPMNTTVRGELADIEKQVTKQLDIILRKESTNTVAKADVLVEGPDGKPVEIAKDVPVTVLVQFEGILADLKSQIYDKIPTLDSTRQWDKDSTESDIWLARDVERVRTKKVPTPIELSPATKEHPAQVSLEQIDTKVGTWVHQVRGGVLSSKELREIVGRLEILMSAIKQARARANGIDAKAGAVGRKMFDFINGK